MQFTATTDAPPKETALVKRDDRIKELLLEAVRLLIESDEGAKSQLSDLLLAEAPISAAS